MGKLISKTFLGVFLLIALVSCGLDNILNPTVMDISLSTDRYTVNYSEISTWTADDLQVTATFGDGSTCILSSDRYSIDYSPLRSMTSTGSCTLTVQVEDGDNLVSAAFIVKVISDGSTDVTEDDDEEEEPVNERYTFTLNSDGKSYTATGYTRISGDTTITTVPSTFNGLPVTGIGDNLFKGNTQLRTINFYSGFETIGERAFEGCTKLASMNLPDSITTIGACAFGGCTSLEKIDMSKNLTNIEICAFQNCSALEKIELPEGVTEIKIYTFSGCTSLSEISMGDITSIGIYAFYGCSSLRSIKLPDSLTYIGQYAFAECAKLEGIDIPSKVSIIGESAFTNCTMLESVKLPNASTSIGTGAFSGCSEVTTVYIANPNHFSYFDDDILADVIILDGATSSGSFYGKTNIKSISLPDSVATIDHWSFYNCTNLKSVEG